MLVFLYPNMSALALLYVIGAYALVLGIFAVWGAARGVKTPPEADAATAPAPTPARFRNPRLPYRGPLFDSSTTVIAGRRA